MAGSKGNLPPLFVLAALAVAVVSLAYLQPGIFTGRKEAFQGSSTLSAASNTAVPAGAASMPGPAREAAGRRDFPARDDRNGHDHP